jgi:hypothetical protein
MNMSFGAGEINGIEQKVIDVTACADANQKFISGHKVITLTVTNLDKIRELQAARFTDSPIFVTFYVTTHAVALWARVRNITMHSVSGRDVKAEVTLVESPAPIEKEKTVAPKSKVKFYVGKQDVCEGTDGYHGELEGWGKATLQEAIDQAKELVEKTGKPQYIVKVIKVVRRKPQPVIVEDVR